MMFLMRLHQPRVHCHVGSLEIFSHMPTSPRPVHCHVGSLEIMRMRSRAIPYVHCHVGSLEN